MSGRFFPLNDFSSSSFFPILIFKTKEKKKERKNFQCFLIFLLLSCSWIGYAVLGIF